MLPHAPSLLSHAPSVLPRAPSSPYAPLQPLPTFILALGVLQV